MKTWQEVLTPFPLAQFFAEYWTQKAIYISADYTHKFHNLFSWNDLNYLLNYHKLQEPDLHFSMNGKSLPQTQEPQNWSDRLRQGATLIVNGVHHRVPTVAKLAADLRHEIGYQTHVNLYCSPAKQQGFNCHYDTHDVLILQIEGNKKWFVFSETVLYPTPEMKSSSQLPPKNPPYLECILKAGDVLYIPRGHWHYAVACEHPSLHLTVGIECQTGLDWLGWLIHELQQNSYWRQSLSLYADNNTQILEQQLTSLKQHLIDTLNQPDILHKYIDALAYCDQPPIPISLPAQIGNDIFPNGFMTRFTWSPLHHLSTKQIGEEHYQVQIGAKRIDLKGIPVNLIKNLCARDEFSLLDIADWVPELDFDGDIAPLITRLVTEGILQIKN